MTDADGVPVKFTITDDEARNARGQKSAFAHHVPQAKIHKYDWLHAETHGDGKPLGLCPDSNAPAVDSLKFRFINPLNNSASANLGRLLGKLTAPIQNSGLREVSMEGAVKEIQKELRERGMPLEEELSSFDVVSFYDNLDLDVVQSSLDNLWKTFMEKSTRNISLEALKNAWKICYEEPVLFMGKFYVQIGGSPTGHPISSGSSNVVMTDFEYQIIMRLLREGMLKIYERWVDDTLTWNKIADRDRILEEFHKFHPKIRFTHELASVINRKLENGQNEERYAIPFLDVLVSWPVRPDGAAPSTEVYRKSTTSRIVMPWAEHGPRDWKIGTLIWFIRRAISHSSTFQLMHKELQFLSNQFREVGYPAAVVSSKIDLTMTRVLYPEHAPKRKDPSELPNKWCVLHLEWAGDQAHKQILAMRYQLPKEHCRISVAYKVTKLASLLPRYTTAAPDPHRIMFARDLVYKYTCHCNQVYIGETERRLAVRVKEHCGEDSNITQHVIKCRARIEANQNLDFTSEFLRYFKSRRPRVNPPKPPWTPVVDPERFTIVARGLRGKDARRRYESLYIAYYNRRAITLNTCTSSKDLVLY